MLRDGDVEASCQDGHDGIARVLLTLGEGADKEKATTRIHPAAHRVRPRLFDAVKLLLEHGADKTKATNDGETPLDFARQQGRPRGGRQAAAAQAQRQTPQAQGT